MNGRQSLNAKPPISVATVTAPYQRSFLSLKYSVKTSIESISSVSE